MQTKFKDRLLILILLIALGLGGFKVFTIIRGHFSLGERLGGSRTLEIDYFMDSSMVEETEEDSEESLLSQLRSQKKQAVEIEEKGETKEEEIEALEKKESTWDKLLGLREKKKKEEKLVLNKKDKKPKSMDEILEEKLEARNSFEDEIKKSRENAKKKVEDDKSKVKDRDKDSKSKEEERIQAIKDAKKEKERKSREEKEKNKAENIVTMHIRCDTAVAKGMADDPKWQGIVPKSGVILGTTSFKIKEGDTVLDLLLAAKDQYKFHMSYRGNAGSAYIEGINNLYEFDGGRWSGWMYSVNSWYPNYGVGLYVLKGGDVVEFNYTCDLGRDLEGAGIFE